MSRQGATAGLGCPLGCLVQRCIFKLINHRCGLKLASVLTLYAHRMVSRQHMSKLWQPMKKHRPGFFNTNKSAEKIIVVKEGTLKVGSKQSQATLTYLIRADTTSCVIPNL